MRRNRLVASHFHPLLAALVLVWVALPAFAAPSQPTIKDLIAPKADGDGAQGAEAKTSGAAKADDELEEADELGRATPRSALAGFLRATEEGDGERAAEYLDLSRLPATQRQERGPLLARELKIVLDRQLWIEPANFSSSPDGRKSQELKADRERVGKIKTERGEANILLARVKGPAGIRIWKFAPETVLLVPALYEQFGYGPLGELLPAPFFEVHFLRVQLWQWIGMLVLVPLAYFAALVVTGLVVRLLGPILRRTRTDIDNRPLAFVTGPLRLVVGVFAFQAAEPALGLAVPVHAVLVGIAKLLIIVAVTWVVLRLLDVVAEVLRERLLRRKQSNVTTLIAPGRKTVKVIVFGIALIATLDNFGFDVTALIAGLGIGGIAVALAAQKSVENLFGGVTLYADQPVRVGDFCRFGDRVGTVEDVGLRSTRVRTLDRTVVAVPNAEFANLQLENFSSRDKIWYHPTIGLRYETTPDQIRYILIEVRKMLYGHPKVDPEPARIRFTNFGAYSLDLEIFAYVRVTDFGEFLEVAEDLNLRIMDIVAQAGSGFAFPSQTAYIEKGGGLDQELARQAEQQVQQWRDENALYLPGFPSEKIRELDDTLDYPPKGSPGAGNGGARR